MRLDLGAGIVQLTELSPMDVVAIGAAVVAVVALALAVVAWRRLRRFDALDLTTRDGVGVAGALARHDDLLRELRADLLVVHDNTRLLRRLAKDPLSHLGLVRFDAFSDLNGAQSYSLAVLDEQGDGVVLTSITGRNESRSYAKQVVGGRVGPTMTSEERLAIERAVAGQRDVVDLGDDDWELTAEAS
jgi:hypothetical protein